MATTTSTRRRRTTSALGSTSSRLGSRSSPASTCSPPSHGARASPATRPSRSAAARTRAPGARASARTSTRSTASISDTTATTASIRPTRPRRPLPAAHWGRPTARLHRSATGAGCRSRSRRLSKQETLMFRKSLMAIAIASLAAGSAWAAVSAAEARQPGPALTAVGAEKAGNKDGTIPEYTGGIKPPAAFQAGTYMRPDPYANEKPRLTISGKDAAAQADKLTEGTKELLKRYPTMRVDVYPTHRTVALPQRILDNTTKNATGAKTVDDGVALENVMPGYPFPIPKTGSEAIWNHLLRYNGLGYDGPRYENWNVDSAGVPTLAVSADANWAWPIFDPKKSGAINASDPYWLVKLQYVGPARRNGEALVLIDAVNPLKQPGRGWENVRGAGGVR